MSVNYVSTPEVNFPPVLGASEAGVLELVIYLLMPVLQNKTNFNGLYTVTPAPGETQTASARTPQRWIRYPPA